MKSKKELARELTKTAGVTYFNHGSFVVASVVVTRDDQTYSAYRFSKCALSFDQFNLEQGIKIAVNRCLDRIARAILAGEGCDDFFSGFWFGDTDYGSIYKMGPRGRKTDGSGHIPGEISAPEEA